jgi:hypothetical protein
MSRTVGQHSVKRQLTSFTFQVKGLTVAKYSIATTFPCLNPKLALQLACQAGKHVLTSLV